MQSSVFGAAGRLFVGIMFPLALGASGCCGCGVGWCSSIFSHRSPPPPVAPLGIGGAGGWFGGFGGAGGGLGVGSPSGPEVPLGLEPALPHVAPIVGSSKNTKFVHDKRQPIRGSLLAKGPGKTVFIAHSAKNAVPVGDGSAFVVAGSTGLWLHETNSLAKRNRLIAEPVLDVAASPDGSKIAYVLSAGRLRIISYPGFASIVSVKVNVPTRMRFSNDGQRLALGSESDTVTLVDVTPGSTPTPRVIDTEEDVNDVFPMPDKPNEVAYASDEDEVVILDMVTKTRAFASEQLVMSWRQSKKPFFVMRDQRTVAFDSVTGTLLGGGDDNMLWRFSNVRTSPKVENPIELSGNVVDIACCAGRKAAERAAFVAIDDAQVRAIGLNGRLGPQFGPLGAHEISQPIRISILPSGDLLVVTMSSVFRWEPRAGATLQSKDYAAELPSPSVIDADSVYVLCDAVGCVVHRVAHAATTVADTETTIAGELPSSAVQSVLRFATGLRAIVVAREGTLHMAYLPVGESLEELRNTKVKPGGYFAEHGPSMHGYVDTSGRVYEIVAIPRGMREIGRALGKGDVIGLNWNSATSQWQVRYSEGTDVYVP